VVIHLIVFIICILLAAFFCSAETAFIGMPKLRLRHLAETGDSRAKIVVKIMRQPEKFLATVLLGTNLSETAVATVGTLMAVSLWGENLGAALATVIVTILTLILSELIPKSLASRHSEKISLVYARPIEIIAIVLYPIVFVLEHIGLRATGASMDISQPKPTISEEELQTAIAIGEAEGVVGKKAAEMLNNVFEFGDRRVSEVMVQRPEVVFVEKGSTLDDFLAIYARSPLSRFPVYEGNQDNVIGMISIKDVLIGIALGNIEPKDKIDKFIRPPYFTIENKPIGLLFAEMRDHNYHMAVVVDEYGAAVGVVSLSQLTEEIVGPIGEEVNPEKEFEIINDNTFQIAGDMRIEDINDQMKLGLPEGDYETLAGFILNLLNRIPKQNEQLRYRNIKILITRMHNAKIAEVLITKDSGNPSPPANQQ
jgi:putative hemolysin